MAWSYKEKYEELLEAARQAVEEGNTSKLKELVENVS
jgi:hypothetical protein